MLGSNGTKPHGDIESKEAEWLLVSIMLLDF